MVQLLIIEGGADAEGRDEDGHSPVDAAKSACGAAVKIIRCSALACELRGSASEGIRWQVRDMKELLTTAGVCTAQFA
jgi:hypothetical protein